MSTFRRAGSAGEHEFSNAITARVRELSKLDNYHALLAVLLDAGWIALAIAATKELGVAFYPVALVIIGARMRGLSRLLHDASHTRLARSRELNEIVGSVCGGWPIFQLLCAYRHSHVHWHHPHLGHAALDPDEVTKNALYSARTQGEFLWLHLIPALLGLKSVTNLIDIVRHRLMYRPRSMQDRAEVLAFCGFWATILTACDRLNLWQDLLAFWIVPYLLTFQVIDWLIELTEHFPRPRTQARPIAWTRNRFGSALETWLTGTHNENYHWTHHLFPAVPFWNLPRAHRVLLADPVYARYCSETGGIFTAHRGRRSIMREILDYFAQRQLRCAASQ